MRTLLSNESGFTLIEVLAASLILVVGLLGLLETVNVGINHNMRNQMRDQAVLISETKMSQFKSRPFDQLTSASPSKTTFEDYSAQLVRGIRKHYNITYDLASVDGTSLNSTIGKKLKVTVNWAYKGQSYTTSLATFKGN